MIGSVDILNSRTKLHHVLQCAELAFSYIRTKHNLTPIQYNALLCVSESKEIVTTELLISYLDSTIDGVSAIALHLVHEGLFIKPKAVNVYTLTSKGRFVLDDIIKQFALMLNT